MKPSEPSNLVKCCILKSYKRLDRMILTHQGSQTPAPQRYRAAPSLSNLHYSKRKKSHACLVRASCLYECRSAICPFLCRPWVSSRDPIHQGVQRDRMQQGVQRGKIERGAEHRFLSENFSRCHVSGRAMKGVPSLPDDSNTTFQGSDSSNIVQGYACNGITDLSALGIKFEEFESQCCHLKGSVRFAALGP
jgi:hypothetical protein